MAEVIDGEGLSSIYCKTRNVGGYRAEALNDNTGPSFVTLACAKKLVERGAGCQGKCGVLSSSKRACTSRRL